ncbi:hypothetical protein F66182_6509 [Fusarium sp. NRRL 66182]|nr:hypothetical protein F66182_6509 [Fusarium sp. NRRL 66182]
MLSDEFAEPVIWSQVELAALIVCSTVPCLWQVVQKVPWLNRVLNLRNGQEISNVYYGKNNPKKTGPRASVQLKNFDESTKEIYLQNSPKSGNGYGLTSNVVGGTYNKNDSTEEIFSHRIDGNDAILVTHEVAQDIELITPRRAPVSDNPGDVEQSGDCIEPNATPVPINESTRTAAAGNPVPEHGAQQESPLALASNDDQQHNLHIVGPAVTSDNQVLSDYLSKMPSAARGSRIIRPVPGNKSRPVLFTMVQKRPVGLDSNRSFPEERLQLIEKMLEPFADDVLDVYFEKVNSSFPLLDEARFRKQYQDNREAISPALLGCLYAHSMVFWDSSPTLSQHRCPDRRFIWNLATEATYSQLHRSPGMSIIEAIILNVGGREVTSLIGNGVLLASSVAMAHSLGLNHSPIPWEIPQSEKNLRMRIWWALLVHDKWISFSHGTPPLISTTQNDVPKPRVENLCEEGSSSEKALKASVYVALVGLTEVLDLHLRHVHQFNNTDETKDTTQLELALNNWVEALNGDVRRVIIRGRNLEVPGAANLRLAYLTVRLLLQRIELEAEKRIRDAGDIRLMNRYLQARRTAEEILILTQELQSEHLADFWLPSSAFAFSTTVSFLLRCALETENSASGLVHSSSLKIASDLLTILRSHREKDAWDLGDICVAQHTEIVEKLLVMSTPEDSVADGSLDLSSFIMPDGSFLDQLFPGLWDPLQSAW